MNHPSRDHRSTFPLGSYGFVGGLLVLLAWYGGAFPVGILNRLPEALTPASLLYKLVLLLGFGASVYGFKRAVQPRLDRLSLAFLMLCTVLYLGAAGFIHWSVLSFAVVPLAIVLIDGLRTHRNARRLFALFVVAYGLSSLATLTHTLIRLELWDATFGVLPGPAVQGFANLAPALSFLGALFLLPSIFLVLVDDWNTAIQNHAAGLSFIAAGFLLTAIGNSILQSPNAPNSAMQITGCVVSYLGFCAFVVANGVFLDSRTGFFLGGKTRFHLLLFGLLVALPTLGGQMHPMLSTLLWLPLFAILFWNTFFTENALKGALGSAASVTALGMTEHLDSTSPAYAEHRQ